MCGLALVLTIVCIVISAGHVAVGLPFLVLLLIGVCSLRLQLSCTERLMLVQRKLMVMILALVGVGLFITMAVVNNTGGRYNPGPNQGPHPAWAMPNGPGNG